MILIWTRHLNIFFSSVLVSNNPPLKIYYENIVVAFLNFNFLFFILIFPYLFFFFIHTFLFFFFFPLFFSTTPFPCLYLRFSFFFSSLALRLLQSIQEAPLHVLLPPRLKWVSFALFLFFVLIWLVLKLWFEFVFWLRAPSILCFTVVFLWEAKREFFLKRSKRERECRRNKNGAKRKKFFFFLIQTVLF